MSVLAFEISRKKRSSDTRSQIGQLVEQKKWRDLISRELQSQVTNKTTMKNISARTGLCVSTISKLVYGTTQFPRMDTIVRILTYLGYRLYAEKIA